MAAQTILVDVQTKLTLDSAGRVVAADTLRPWTIKLAAGSGAWVNVSLLREDGKILREWGYNHREQRWSYNLAPPANVVKAMRANLRAVYGQQAPTQNARIQSAAPRRGEYLSREQRRGEYLSREQRRGEYLSREQRRIANEEFEDTLLGAAYAASGKC